jgi:hypothetical protein
MALAERIWTLDLDRSRSGVSLGVPARLDIALSVL